MSVSLICCSQEWRTIKSSNAVSLVTIMPIHHPNDPTTTINFRGEITLFEVDSINICRLLKKRPYSKIILDKNHDMVSDELVKVDTVYYFVIFKNGDKSGLKYDSTADEQWKKISVDSFLATTTLFSVDKFLVKKMQNDSLISSVTNLGGKSLTETYLPKSKPDFTYSDTTILRYADNLDNLNFSFSRHLDSLKNIKLCSVEMIYNPNPNATDPFYKSRRSYTFEMKRLEFDETSFIRSLVTEFLKRQKLSE